MCTGSPEEIRRVFREYHLHFFGDSILILRLKNLYTICFPSIINLELNT
jgi:hypothetical protein